VPISPQARKPGLVKLCSYDQAGLQHRRRHVGLIEQEKLFEELSMEKHIKIIGVLNLVFGLMGVVACALCLVVFVGGFAILGAIESDPVPVWLAGGIGAIFAVIMAVAALPNLLAGYGLLKRRQWGRVLAIIVAVIDLPAFPFGTALGIYTLAILLHGDSQALFSDRQVVPNQTPA
jgi:hypothetical protein